jgi:hypothetical protein
MLECAHGDDGIERAVIPGCDRAAVLDEDLKALAPAGGVLSFRQHSPMPFASTWRR